MEPTKMQVVLRYRMGQEIVKNTKERKYEFI